MDAIFQKTPSWLAAVRVAHDEPRRFGKHGERLLGLEDGGNLVVERTVRVGGEKEEEV